MANEEQRLDPASIAQDPAMRSRMSPGAAGQANIIDIGFAQAGVAFGGGDPNVGAAWRQAGQNITGILQQRWFQKEYETFEQQALQPMVERVRGIGDSLVEKFGQLDSGQLVAPDGTVQQINPESVDVARMKQTLLSTHINEMAKATDDLFAAAGKYGAGNPFITQRVFDIMQSTATTVNALTNPAVAKQEQEFAKLEGMGAATDLKGAQAEQARAQAELFKRTDPNLRAGSEKDDSALNASQYLQKYGVEETLTYMMQGQAGWMQPYRDQQMAVKQAEISEDAMKDPKLGARVGVTYDKKGQPQTAPDPELVKVVADESKVEVMEKAAAVAANSLFSGNPQVQDYIRTRPNLSQWLEEVGAAKEKPKFTGRATEADIRTKAKEDWQDTILPGMEAAIQQGNIHSKAQIAEWLRDKVEQHVKETIGDDPVSRATAQKLGDELLRIAKTKWSDSELAKELTGEFSWFERGQRLGGKALRGLLD